MTRGKPKNGKHWRTIRRELKERYAEIFPFEEFPERHCPPLYPFHRCMSLKQCRQALEQAELDKQEEIDLIEASIPPPEHYYEDDEPNAHYLVDSDDIFEHYVELYIDYLVRSAKFYEQTCNRMMAKEKAAIRVVKEVKPLKPQNGEQREYGRIQVILPKILVSKKVRVRVDMEEPKS